MLEKFDNDWQLFKSVATIYLNDYKGQLTTIQACLAKDDRQGLIAAAHTLKGAAGNFSEKLVSSVAADIESYLRSGNIDAQVVALVSQLSSEAHALDKEISKVIAHIKETRSLS